MNGSSKRNKVVYLPYLVRGSRINEYVANMINVLQDEYLVLGVLAEPFNIPQMLQTKAVFLNWIENDNRLNFKVKVQLMLYKLFGTKIIWVFHNRYPHGAAMKSKGVRNMNWLARNSNIIILHSKESKKYIPNKSHNSEKAVYIPHILYDQQNEGANLDNIRTKYGIYEDDFVFTMFGEIRPHKNIEGGVAAFEKLHLKNAKLLIAGNPTDVKYAKKIEMMCQGNKDIILDFHYISNIMLDNMIDISDVILIPYCDRSYMNSGVMIRSFSKGTTVIVSDICMAKDLKTKSFFYMYHNSLAKTMLRAYKNGKSVNKDMGIQAKEYIEKNNNREIVKKRLYNIFMCK